MKRSLSMAFTLLIIFSTYMFTGCSSKVIRIREGKNANLIFHYPCNSTEVTLRHGYKEPFYNSAKLNSMPLNKHVIKDKSGSDKCSIHLIIKAISREDEGTYIMTAYKDGVMFPDYPRIRLHVMSPPGKASCESSNHYDYDGDWESLLCKAPMGDIAGHIMCYQNTIRLPSLTNPEENGDTLSQVILIRNVKQPVICCSISFDIYRNFSDCTDFAWDPILNIAVEFSEIQNYTYGETPEGTVDTNPTKNPTCPTMINATGMDATHKNKSGQLHWGLYLCIGIILILVIILVIVVVILGVLYYKRGKKTNELENKCDELIKKVAKADKAAKAAQAKEEKAEKRWWWWWR